MRIFVDRSVLEVYVNSLGAFPPSGWAVSVDAIGTLRQLYNAGRKTTDHPVSETKRSHR